MLISYLAIAAAMFLVMGPVKENNHPDAILWYVHSTHRGRWVGALLWPLLIMYVALKLYKAKE